MDSNFLLSMILIVYEFTSDDSRALEQSLKFAVVNIVALKSYNKCMVFDAKISFKNYFAFNDHTIFHSTKTNIRDRCDGTNNTTMWGWYGKDVPWIKNNQESSPEDS